MSPSNLSIYCPCHAKMTGTLDPRHIWSVTYNAGSNKCHPPTSPNIVPATQNDCHAWSSSHMKCHLQCAEQRHPPTPPNTAPATQNDHPKSDRNLPKTAEKCHLQRAADPSMIQEWSEHEPVSPQPAAQPRLLFALRTSISYWKQQFAPRLSFQISPSNCACHEKLLGPPKTRCVVQGRRYMPTSNLVAASFPIAFHNWSPATMGGVRFSLVICILALIDVLAKDITLTPSSLCILLGLRPWWLSADRKMAPTIQWRHQDQLCSFSTSDERRLGPLTLQLGAALMNTEFVQAHPTAPICIQLFWLMHPALGRYGWPFNMHLCQVSIVPPMGRRASCRPPELLIT